MNLYAVLLRLFPKSFRLEYGEEMRRIFDRRRASTDDPLSRARLWLEALMDVIPNALMAHVDILRQDLTFTARTLLRTPGFTLTAIVVAALGIGATTAAFSVTDRVLFRELPFGDSERLVSLYQAEPGYSRFEPSPSHYRDWKQMNTVFTDLGASASTSMNLIGDGEPLRVNGSWVTSNLFDILRVAPQVGRLFTPEEDMEGAPGTVILSYGLWVEAFGGAASAVGRTIRLDEQSYTVIGVMPRNFSFPNRATRFWTPFRFNAGAFEDRDNHYLNIVGRLKPGVSLDGARAGMKAVNARLRLIYPKENDLTLALLRDQVPQQARLLLVALFGAALCVLLIACTNLASLLIARSLQRRKELAVRTAIGAGRERLIRQLVTESIVLSLLGGIMGIALAYGATPLLAQLAPANLPLPEMAAIDARILAFAALMTIATGLGFGIVPALALNGENSLDGLREGARGGVGGRRRLRSALVFAEVAISVVLLASCGLLIRALWKVQSTDPGFATEGLLTARTSLPVGRYSPTAARAQFYEKVLTEIRALPGVKSAAFTSFLPMVMRGGIWDVKIPGRDQNRAEDKVSMRFITPGYFETMGIPLLKGRDFNSFDTRSAPSAVVVSESFAKRYWPDQDPLGRVVNVTFEDRIIVGVAADVKVRGLERISEPQAYLGHQQVNDGWVPFYAPKDLAVRVSGDPAALSAAVRDIIRRADPLVPLSDVRTMKNIIEAETASRSAQLAILEAFALIATLLAAIGLQGLISFSVSCRLQEIGVRMVLGASKSHIVRLVIDDGLRLAAAGVVVGIGLAYAAGRSMAALLAGLDPLDAPTFLAAVALSALMAATSSLLPAMRAARVNPTSVMRIE
ncbi:MAG: ABC transporter permease [Vicinamibacteria bacterium]|nr:ABC transporter permease [Vicinamibacteria bacterium]